MKITGYTLGHGNNTKMHTTLLEAVELEDVIEDIAGELMGLRAMGRELNVIRFEWED